MSGLILIILVVLIMVVLYQVGKSSEMMATIQGEKEFEKKSNNIMGYVMLGILPIFFASLYACHKYMMPMMIPEAASDHGKDIDSMMLVTIWITGIVFVITQVLTFWFAFKYRGNGKQKPFFYSHNNKLELIWTVIPALTMAVLVGIGLKAWFKMTSAAPANAMQIEVTGKQFNWISRYPGPDGVIGKKYFTNINEKDNILGLDWTDPKTKDDIIIPNGEIRLIKGKPVELIIGSRDVIHDVGLAHFRLKMDAVPGITSRMWFTPTITTEEMKIKTKNPNFVYEISCDQMCGVSHYSMRAVIVVETEAEHKAWLAKQQSYWAQNHPEEQPVTPTSDTSAKVTMK